MTYAETMAAQVDGLEIAIAAIEGQKSFAYKNNICGEEGENGIKLAFAIIEGTLEGKLKMAKACKDTL